MPIYTTLTDVTDEIRKIVDQGAKLEPYRGDGEPVTGQARPDDRVRSLPDVQLRRAALVVERRHPF